MRLLSVAIATAATALMLAGSASAGLWLDLDSSTASPGQTVHGKAVSPCGACGPAPLFLVRASDAALRLLKNVPRGDPRFVPVDRFTWKRGGRFTFQVPDVRPGLYQLMAVYRNGPAWTVVPASTLLRVRASLRVSFGVFSIVVPRAWHWRTLRGPEPGSRIVQFSNSSFRVRRGRDPIKEMGPQSFVLTLVPLGEYGSHTSPTIERRDFLGRSDPSRPRGHALARHSYCSSGGRCFSIQLEYGSERVPNPVLASVNRVLRSLRAVPLRKVSSAAARNPWTLHCPSMPSEQRAPSAVRRAAHAFFPWAGRYGEDALRAGPIWLLALSTHTAISRDGDDTDSSGYYLHRALVAVAPSYRGTVVLTGRRVGRPAPRTTLGFSTTGATHCTVSGVDVSCAYRPLRFASSLRIASGSGWRIVATELRIGRTGCFRVIASGSGLREIIPLAVPGPDWRPHQGW